MPSNAPWDLPPGTPSTTYDRFADSPVRPSAPPLRGDRRRGILLLVVGLTLLIVVPVVWFSWAVNNGEPLGSLEVGRCFTWRGPPELAPDQKQTKVFTIDCSQPHDSELFAKSPFNIPAPTAIGPRDYPGVGWLLANGATACRDFLPEYTGDAALAARLVVMVAIPDAVEWQQGDLDSLCIASFPGGPGAGSVRAADN